jgi:hypothetical protein
MSAKIRKKWKSPKHYPFFSPAGGSFPFLSGAALARLYVIRKRKTVKPYKNGAKGGEK